MHTLGCCAALLLAQPVPVEAQHSALSQNRLEREQSQQRLELEEQQQAYRAKHQPQSPSQAWELEERLRQQRTEQGEQQLRQRQEAGILDLNKGSQAPTPRAGGAAGKLEEMRRERQGLGQELHLRMQRESWPYPRR